MRISQIAVTMKKMIRNRNS